MTYRETIEWCDIWVAAACDASLPRALLIGDSITRSYYPLVQTQLAKSYACARIASSKCVSDPMFIKELELVLGEYDFSVIHFNNGLHGWDYSEQSYGRGLARAFDTLLMHCGTANVIWGSTTPVWAKDKIATLDIRTERVRERNKIAAVLADDRGICINDLFTAVVDRPELVSQDGVHFLEDGQAELGRYVGNAILNKASINTEQQEAFNAPKRA
jgi:hypothetical protein